MKIKKINTVKFLAIFLFLPNDEIWATYFFHFEFIPEYCDLLETQTRRCASNRLTFPILYLILSGLSLHGITMRVLRGNEVKKRWNANRIPKETLSCAIFHHV